nr:NADP-dependent oxidoreductase [Hyphomonas sp. Mor2]
MRNRAVLLRQRPIAGIDDQTFELDTRDSPDLRDGDIRVEVKYISLDPAMRPWVHDKPNYLPPVEIGAVMRAGGAGIVTASKHDDFEVGDAVQGMFGAQSIYVGPAAVATKIDTSIAPMEAYLGGLGGTGLAAYFGLLKVGDLRKDDKVLISAAAGAVGHIAVQIAKLKGAYVVGIAGGEAKCRNVVETFGADACIDYKSESVADRLPDLFEGGIDLYFDNVGGEILEAALDHLAMRARIVVSGAIGQYDHLDEVHAPRNYLNLIGPGARMQGLLNMHWAKHFPAARKELAAWHADGRIQFHRQIEDGIETFPQVLQMLFAGKNTGKLMLKV